MQIKADLNEKQWEAVEYIDGPLLILAGAGAGKTRVITHRIHHLVKRGVPPQEILAVTFTNKAAREMRERTRSLIAQDPDLAHRLTVSEEPFVSTFHSLGVHLLREYGSVIGIPKRFTIFDRSDSVRALKEAVREVGLDPKQFEPRKILSAISRIKGEGVTLRRYEEEEHLDYKARYIEGVWRAYERILSKENALDFDDLLLKAFHMLKSHAHVLAHAHERWKYIHIDEYQDTNRVQYELARLLTGQAENICVVGDLDQNIYSWRGATIENILNFEKAFPRARVILLEQNYRSTKSILDASNEIIKKNKRRKEKRLFTTEGPGEPLSVSGLMDENHEARFAALKVKELIEKGVQPRSVALLYRANFQSRALEEAFLSENLPYQVLGVRFFERKEVKDMLAYLRLSLESTSTASVARVINVPPRGIGKVTLLKIIEGREHTLPSKMRERVASFKDFIAALQNYKASHPLSEVIRFALSASGLKESLEGKGEEELERLENLKELVSLAKRYDALPGEEGILKLLEDAALATDQDELSEDRDAVKLMTVHAAKGLEFDYVFITGLEEGLFPHAGIESEYRDEEEERRLFYVALTRARKKVFLLFASMRTIFGSQTFTVPSQFISDIPSHLLVEEEALALRPEKTIYLD